MIVLDAVTDALQVVLAGAVTTSQLACYSAYRDITTTAYTPGKVQTATNNTTDVSVVTPPAAATQRVVDYVSVYNGDTAAAVLTVKFDASGTERILWKGSLAVGEKVEYAEGVGWRNFDATGTVKGIGATGAAGANGGGTVLGSGTSVIDFGSVGSTDASLVVIGQPLILAGSQVVCWIKPVATATHSADEHLVEQIRVVATSVVAGVGFTLRAFCTAQTSEPMIPRESLFGRFSGTGAATGGGQRGVGQTVIGGAGPVLRGAWTIGWLYTQ